MSNLELQKIIKQNITKKIVFICIGTEKHVWDSVGPFVGTFLTDFGYKDVYGTIGESANSDTIEYYREYIKNNYEDSFVIAIDAAITENKEEHKTLIIQNGGVSPGSAIGKKIEPIGDLSFLINIYETSFHNNKNIATPFILAKDIAMFINKNILNIINQEERVMKKCKICGGNSFLAEAIQTSSFPVKIVNEEVVETYTDQEEVLSYEVKICYCCNCEKEITEEDIVSLEVCSVCGKEVDSLSDGKCHECSELLVGVSSPEELLAKILKGEISIPDKIDKIDKIDATKKTPMKEAKAKRKPKEPNEAKEVKEEEVKVAEVIVKEKATTEKPPSSVAESIQVDKPAPVVSEANLDTTTPEETTEIIDVEPIAATDSDLGTIVDSLSKPDLQDWDF